MEACEMLFKSKFKNLLKCEDGSVMIEYGVIASLMTICVIAVFPFIVGAISAKFVAIKTPFDAL